MGSAAQAQAFQDVADLKRRLADAKQVAIRCGRELAECRRALKEFHREHAQPSAEEGDQDMGSDISSAELLSSSDDERVISQDGYVTAAEAAGRKSARSGSPAAGTPPEPPRRIATRRGIGRGAHP